MNIQAKGQTVPCSNELLVSDNAPYDILCFSHLRWHFVTQRPQHLLSRFARKRRVFFWEEPFFDADGEATLESMQESDSLWVLRPHLPRVGDADLMQHELLVQFMGRRNVTHFVRWYYTPLALGFSSDLKAEVTVYDCMDELTGFLGAPPQLRERENELFACTDVVFTGGISLYEAKRTQHENVHAFPSSIDVSHFAAANGVDEEPADQIGIAHPRAGFFGVLDERLDLALLTEVARLRPHVQFVLVGPVVKIDPATLPQAANVHYLGAKSYSELPRYLAGWDVALLPFALNDSTKFISPTKTPEYLAAGKPVVSTPIRDVIREYGDEGLVAIARTAGEFAHALDQSFKPTTSGWREAVDAKLAAGSWDKTYASMVAQINKVRNRSVSLNETAIVTNKFLFGESRQIVNRVNSHRFDYLIVGAGFAGAVLAERIATVMGKRVLIIDKRDHVGGNTFDYRDASEILVHKYGPHIFHTNSLEIVEYLSRFTGWRQYEHRVLASVDGKLLPMPINLDTINGLYGLNLDAAGMQEFLARRAVISPSVRTSEDICVSRVGRELYEKFFKSYTRKQWGLDPSQLDASVAGRIPVRFNRDDRYFSDTFQMMPSLGYTRLFENMLDHPNITIRTGVNYAEVAAVDVCNETIFTGPIDEFFDYRFGPLPYRSLDFKHETYDCETYQVAPVINYPNDHAYTRVTEFKYLTGQIAPQTSVVYEYPKAEGDPYYPIPRPENAAIYGKYKELADRTDKVHFVGRLASYKYYNMDQVVAQALTMFRKLAGNQTVIVDSASEPEGLLAEAR